jgi:acetylornithine deacetylase/succinyl-diaminopimelate desuccinylase family protein
MQPDFARMQRILAALVAADSQNPPGREAEVAAVVTRKLTEAGCTTELDAYAPGRANVIGRFENGPGPVFALNTHMDVVPCGEGWSTDPLELRAVNGRLYGRGACDCKGPLAAMLEAMRLLIADRESWSGTLLGIFVADEETASAGARRIAACGMRIDHAVIGEPTGNRIAIAHKGSLRPLVRVRGVATHSSAPDDGDNAIYRAATLIGLVERLHADTIRHRTHPLTGAASLTITRANAGVADNVVPDAMDLLLDRRIVPGEDEAAVKAELEGFLRDAEARHGIRTEILEWRATTGGAAETRAEAPIVAAALAASRAAGVAECGPIGFPGACDFVHFRTLGAEAVIVGPGSLSVAHKPDEFVPTDEFFASCTIYRDIARSMLARGRRAAAQR